MRNFYIGCAVWAYKDWIGDLFPAGSKTADFLALYSRRLTTVEGNTSFDAIPSTTSCYHENDRHPLPPICQTAVRCD